MPVETGQTQPAIDESLWKDVPDHPGYQVHPAGLVRSFWTRSGHNGDLKATIGAIPKILKCAGGGAWGYKTVNFGRSGGTISRHRLIAKTFLPNPDNKPEVNHKNGIPGDDWIDNLEWVTKSENAIHKCHVLGRGQGEDNPGSRLTEDNVWDIVILSAFGAMGKDLAKAFKVSKSTISLILNGRVWASVTGIKPYAN